MPTWGRLVSSVVIASLLLPLWMVTATADEGAGDLRRLRAFAGSVDPKLSVALARTLAGSAWASTDSVAGFVRRDQVAAEARAGMVQVEIVAAGANDDDGAAVAAAVLAAGGSVLASWAHLTDALVPRVKVEALAASPAVALVRHPIGRERHSVTNEAVVGSDAAAWHGANIKGAGVKIAIIDGGFAGYQARQRSGDLPARVVTKDYCGGGLTRNDDHGTAVAEIVHEMAPQAELYLICESGTTASLGMAADYAVAQGVHIINLSSGTVLNWRGDGRGGAGTVDAIVRDTTALGVLWVVSSGNYGMGHWSGKLDPDSQGFHRFRRGDYYNDVQIGRGQSVCFSMRWDAWPATSVDYDLLLYDARGRLVDWSIEPQTGSQKPIEGFCGQNNGATARFGLVIVDATGSSVRPRIDLFVQAELQYGSAVGSVADPATSPDAFAVGAMCWSKKTIASYSSQGPTIDGRVKPDISAAAGVSSATYGASRSCRAGTGFEGTSASAPHVAGAAALLKQANPSFTAAQLRAELERRSADLGARGKDNAFGAGKLALGTPTGGSAPSPTPGAGAVKAASTLLVQRDLGSAYELSFEKADTIEDQAALYDDHSPYGSAVEMLRAWGYVDSHLREFINASGRGVWGVVSQATSYTTTTGGLADHRVNRLSAAAAEGFRVRALGATIGDESIGYWRDFIATSSTGAAVRSSQILIVFRVGTISHTLSVYAYRGQLSLATAVRWAKVQAARSAARTQTAR